MDRLPGGTIATGPVETDPMIRDTLRAALAAFVLWPMMPPARPPADAIEPAAPPVLMMPPAPSPVLMMPPPAPPAGPVARVLGAADRLAARWLP